MIHTARPVAALTQTPVLETERLVLRAPGPADLSAMLGFLTSDRARFYAGPHDAGDAWQVFAAYIGQWILRGYGMFAVVHRDSGETIGMAGPYHPEHFNEAEMSWLLCDVRHEGHGFATEAVRAALDHLRATQDVGEVLSLIHPANTASQRVAMRLGARRDPATPSPLPDCEAWRHPAGDAA